MSLWSRFIKLKTAVGGNREAVRYEESFGMTLEEQHHNFKRWGSQGGPPKGCSKVSPVQLGSASPAWQV